MPNYRSLVETAIRASLKAGHEILDVYEHHDFEIEAKSDNSPLTLADRRAHDAIVAELSAASGAEQLPILSEEGRSIPYQERQNWKEMWVVDPLDGTKEFIKRNGEFTVNVALVKDGVPILGVIYVPVDGELYFTVPESPIPSEGASEGAWMSVVPGSDAPAVAAEPDLAGVFAAAARLPRHGRGRGEAVRVIASRSHRNEPTEAFITRTRQVHGDITEVSTGSSRKLCFIADGRADVYPRYAPTMEWDTAAGHAILIAAGGQVSRTDADEALQYNKEDLLNPWFVAYREEKYKI